VPVQAAWQAVALSRTDNPVRLVGSTDRSYKRTAIRYFTKDPLSKMAGMHEGRVLSNLVAVDIGNSRLKLGQFQLEFSGANEASSGDRAIEKPLVPEPVATFDLPIRHDTGEFDASCLIAWCDEHLSEGTTWRVASVHRAAASRLIATLQEWAKQQANDNSIRQITYRDVPLAIRVDEPARVGIDRLLAAVAAGRLRQRERAAIVVDLGTAITVDLVEPDGAFAGGAILPGIGTSARALAEQTDALPQVHLEFLDRPPAALGKSTVPAIESGIYWGAIGAIRELVAQLSVRFQTRPDLFITGGASRQVADLLKSHGTIRHVPNLVLSGIALVNV
jgi:type III pantothenate kinase